MALWRFVWREVVWLSQENPPQLVEGMMLVIAAPLCVAWFFLQQWQYLVLSLSYILGTIASILVRESIAPSANTAQIRLTALLSLLILFLGVGLYLLRVPYLSLLSPTL